MASLAKVPGGMSLGVDPWATTTLNVTERSGANNTITEIRSRMVESVIRRESDALVCRLDHSAIAGYGMPAPSFDLSPVSQ